MEKDPNFGDNIHCVDRKKYDRSMAYRTNFRNARSAAFAIHAQPVRNSDGERLLPAIESDNYFTLMPGQSKTITFTFSPTLLDASGYTLKVNPYNN